MISPAPLCVSTTQLFGCVIAALWLLSAPSQAQAIAPLPAQTRAILFGSPADKSILRNHHYVKTNERRHDLFRPFIKGLRGGYIGIASDQNYTLMAYARSEFAWLIDYDAMIQDLHRVHRAMILASATATAYLQRWRADRRAVAVALLQKAYASHPRRAAILKAYRYSQRRLWRYLGKRSKADPKTRPNWLNTPAFYRYIKGMYEAGRIRIMHGNLVGQRSLYGIGQAAKKAGIPIRVFYTSNAEEWVKYRAAFRRNINALYVDEKSVMIRTLWLKMFQPRASDLWQYNIQKLRQFQRFLRKRDSWVGSLNRQMRLSHLWGTTLIGFPDGFRPK